MVFWSADRGEPLVLCAQGVAPAEATIARFRSLGHELVPGTGLLAACVPGAFGGWIRLLRDFGTWRLDDILAYAIGYADGGYPVVPGITATIEQVAPLLREWPASAELYLPAPQPGSTFRNPALAATWQRLLDEARGGSREDELDRAHAVFYEGFVADEIDRYSSANGGLLTGADLSAWQPRSRRRRRSTTGVSPSARRAPGSGARGAAAAGAARRLRRRRHERSRAGACHDGVRQARVRGPRRPVRRPRRAARAPAVARVRGREAQARRRGRERRASARVRTLASHPRHGRKRARCGGADARRHGSPGRRRPLRQPRRGHTERRVAAGSPDASRSRLAARHAGACSGSRRGCRSSLRPGTRPRTTLSSGLVCGAATRGSRGGRPRRRAGAVADRRAAAPCRSWARPAAAIDAPNGTPTT